MLDIQPELLRFHPARLLRGPGHDGPPVRVACVCTRTHGRARIYLVWCEAAEDAGAGSVAGRPKGPAKSKEPLERSTRAGPPSRKPPLDSPSYTILEVRTLTPRAATCPLSAELRAGLQLKLVDSDSMTYASHSTPRSISPTATPAVSSVAEDLIRQRISLQTTTLLSESCGTEEGSATRHRDGGRLSRVGSCSRRPSLLGGGSPPRPASLSSPGCNLSDALDASADSFSAAHWRSTSSLAELRDVYVQGRAVQTGTGGGLTRARPAERKTTLLGMGPFNYKKATRRVLSALHLSDGTMPAERRRVGGSPAARAAPVEAADPIATTSMASDAESSLILRFMEDEALLKVLTEYVAAVPPPSALAPPGGASVDDVPDLIAPRCDWEEFLRREGDPRFDGLTFARVPLYLWHSMRHLASSALYTCDRGFLSVEAAGEEDDISPASVAASKVPGAGAPHPHADAADDDAEDSNSSWDTVKLLITSPVVGHGGPAHHRRSFSDLHEAVAAAPRHARPPGTLFKDCFMYLMDSNVLFYNSFGVLKAHLSLSNLSAVLVFPAPTMVAARAAPVSTHGTTASARAFPFITFKILAGEDALNEPPLSLTFTFLPFVPHHQHPGAADMKASVPESTSDEVWATLVERQNEFLSKLRCVCPLVAPHSITYTAYLRMVEKSTAEAAVSSSVPVRRRAATCVVDVVQVGEDDIEEEEDGEVAPGAATGPPRAAMEEDRFTDYNLIVRLATHPVAFISEKEDLFLPPLPNTPPHHRDPHHAHDHRQHHHPENRHHSQDDAHRAPAREADNCPRQSLRDADGEFAAMEPKRERNQLVRRERRAPKHT